MIQELEQTYAKYFTPTDPLQTINQYLSPTNNLIDLSNIQLGG